MTNEQLAQHRDDLNDKMELYFHNTSAENDPKFLKQLDRYDQFGKDIKREYIKSVVITLALMPVAVYCSMYILSQIN
jgi:hypothetical protein